MRDDCKRLSIVARRQPRFYLRLAPRCRRGLTLLLVIRGGLGLGECLDGLSVGRTALMRLTLEPSSRMRGGSRVSHPHPAHRNPSAMSLASSVSLDSRALPSSTVSKPQRKSSGPGSTVPCPCRRRVRWSPYRGPAVDPLCAQQLLLRL